MIRSFPGPDKGQREPGWKVSMAGSRLISVPASRSLLPGLVLSRVSPSRPWCETPRGPGTRQIQARPSSFLFLSPDPTFLPLPVFQPLVQRPLTLRVGYTFPHMTHFPQGKKTPLPRSVPFTGLQVRTESHPFCRQMPSMQSSHIEKVTLILLAIVGCSFLCPQHFALVGCLTLFYMVPPSCVHPLLPPALCSLNAPIHLSIPCGL